MGCVLKTLRYATLRYATHVVMEVASCLRQGSGVMSLPTVCGTNSKGALFSFGRADEISRSTLKKLWPKYKKINPHILTTCSKNSQSSHQWAMQFGMQIRMGTTHDKSTPAITNFKFCWCCICFAQWNCEHSMRLECEKCHVVPQSAVSGGPT